jgi:hypothetical protein
VKALEHCVRLMGKGRVSVEFIAGIEPAEETMRGIEYVTGVGAVPYASVFRPISGSGMENDPPPDPAEMMKVFRHIYQNCRAHNLPIGVTPNIRSSLQPNPVETLYLAQDPHEVRAYQRWISTMQQMMRPYFTRRMRKHTISQS